MLESFEHSRIKVSDTTINVKTAGSGPPVLMLHGYPQTHVMWHKVAPALSEHFTVVLTDLRGYGDSGKPATTQNHAPYSKRAMAQDQVEVMASLGYDSFALVGHDRGARVAHRLTLDHPGRVTKVALLDIAPTLTMYERTDMTFASAYFHWFFLIQPYDFPERLIAADTDYYVEAKIGKWSKVEDCFSPEALSEYKRCFADPATVHATCEDYRAAADIDLDHDRADLNNKIACPLLVLWGAMGVVERCYDVLEVWREHAEDAHGKALPCGHFLPEEAPAETLAALCEFL